MYNLSETIAWVFFFFFFFLVLTNPQDIVQLNNIFEKIMKEKNITWHQLKKEADFKK